jgi:lycopene cyclase domain-containing protein
MTYTALAAVAVLFAATVDIALLRTRLLATKAFWLAYAILLFFQILMNGTLTGLKIVRYNAHDILGPRIVFAPMEDLAFGFAMILLTLSSWRRLTGRRSP